MSAATDELGALQRELGFVNEQRSVDKKRAGEIETEIARVQKTLGADAPGPQETTEAPAVEQAVPAKPKRRARKLTRLTDGH